MTVLSSRQQDVRTLVCVFLKDARVEVPGFVDYSDDEYWSGSNTPLSNATTNGHTDVVRLLLADARVDPTTDQVPMHRPIERGNADTLRILLTDGRVDPWEGWDHVQIELAFWNGYTEVLRLLISDGRMKPSRIFNKEALHHAIRRRRGQLVEFLLSNLDIDPSEDNNEALRLARETGDPDIERLLLADPRTGRL